MCDCLNETEKQVKVQIEETLKSKGQELVGFVEDGEEGFQNKGMFFNGGGWGFVLPMKYRYILRKKDGTPEKRVTTKNTNMLPNFCPLCGEKIVRN